MAGFTQAGAVRMQAMTEPESGRRPDPAGSTPAALQADRLVAAVRDDPARRLRLAAGFYDQRADGRSIRAYRRAEVAFMRWQIRCGVLAPVDAAQPGSPWWRAVNESLLRDAAEADLLCNGAAGPATTKGVELWLAFLRRPTPQAWYRAHNASIVAGYLRHRGLVCDEGPLERFFMDVALLRVIYAHCLLIRPRLALGRLAAFGRFLGDPRRRAADLFLSLQNVLPNTYPLMRAGIETVLADENYLARIMDYGVIAPRIDQLYRAAADDLDEPRIVDLCSDNFPVYAWPYEERHVWRTDRSPIAIALTRAVVGPSPRSAGR
ncbi:hypothetical protein Vau01_047240 [Virgisporangium aurantiacum]|uniref:Uncharacterized protein n=2 Tax=Virgisporangium aurantiacum TaxID=175570 RepID=A0A8J4E0Y6_9ACTN|nr:hypothetical protein Vau01_047240 [Virgisporangium aurantiacum]